MKILSPMVKLMQNLTYPKKFSLIGIIFILVLLFLAYYISSNLLKEIGKVNRELEGVAYVKLLNKLMVDTQEFRREENLYLIGMSPTTEKIISKQNDVDQTFQELLLLDDKLGADLKTTASLKSLQSEWEQLKKNAYKLPLPQNYVNSSIFIDKIINLMDFVKDTSGLAFDPNLDTHYLSDFYAEKLPQILERVRRIFGYGLMALHGKLSAEDYKIHLISSAALIKNENLPITVNHLQKVMNHQAKFMEILKPLTSKFVSTIDELFSDAKQIADNNANRTQVTQDIIRKNQIVTEEGNSITKISINDAQNLYQEQLRKLKRQLFISLFIIASAIIILMLLFTAIYLSILKSIKGLVKGTENLENGDLSAPIELESKDELSRVASSFNTMRENLGEIIAETQAVVDAINDGDLTKKITTDNKRGFAKHLSASINEIIASLDKLITEIKLTTSTINTAAKEIAAGNMDLSRRTESQAASLEETFASMEQLSAAVKQNANNSKSANELSESASAVALQGGELFNQVTENMTSIDESSKKVAEISSVIDEIAFQTNILALNASVEAAHAGEQGKGFAVVANEVRNLAQRSATAAKEIKTLINNSLSKVNNGTKLVDEAGEIMNKIVTSIQEVTTLIADISTASMQQSTGIDQINEAVLQLEKITEQNAALVEEAAAASESLESQTQNLEDEIKIYKVNQEKTLKSPVERVAPKKTITPVKKIGINKKTLPSKPTPPTSTPKEDEWEEF